MFVVNVMSSVMHSLHKAVTHVLMKKTVNNDVSRDSPSEHCFLVVVFMMLYKVI